MELGTVLFTIASILGGVALWIYDGVRYILGGWDILIIGLFMMMFLDMVTGLSSAFMNKSSKTESGGFSSTEMYKGLLSKVVILCVVVATVFIDMVIGTELVRDIAILFYIMEEGMSILENTSSCGLPVPKKIVKFLDVMREQINSDEKKQEPQEETCEEPKQ